MLPCPCCPSCVYLSVFQQNNVVKKENSLDKLKAISWGGSGDRLRSRPEFREGWLSVEDQVRPQWVRASARMGDISELLIGCLLFLSRSEGCGLL